MWDIRTEQYAVFERVAEAEFEDRAIAQLRESLPDRVGGMADDFLRGRVRSAMLRAGEYELDTEIEVLYFLNVSFLLGDAQFDTNPEFLWARDILLGGGDPAERAEALFDAASARGLRPEGETA